MFRVCTPTRFSHAVYPRVFRAPSRYFHAGSKEGLRKTPALALRRFASNSKELPPHVTITMPALSPTMTSGNIGTWHKKVGDEIAPGDVLVEIETDKAQMDFECQEEGFLAKVFKDPGSKEVPINTPIAVLVENKDDIPKFADFMPTSGKSKNETSTSPEASVVSKPAAVEEVVASTPTSSSPSSGRVIASPVAKKTAAEKGIDLKTLKGSGPNNRIVKADVENYKPSAVTSLLLHRKNKIYLVPESVSVKASSVVDADFTDTPLTNMRSVIAKRLQESKSTIPHYYLTVEINLDKILQLRKVLNEQGKDKFKLSVNDFIIKASALALQHVPEVNSAWKDSFIRRFHHSDICVAVATPSGLITPIVKKAETLGLSSISYKVKDMALRARENKLAPHEYQGGSFTISNLGMYGIKNFTAIINPPQSCILAVGGTEAKMVPDASQPNGFAVANVMQVTLSCDHRVVDGAVGSQWLAKFKEVLENPLNLLL